MESKVKLLSFGFKYGPPIANYYFDVSFLKNPAREEGWNLTSAVDSKMEKFILEQPIAMEFVNKVVSLIETIGGEDGNQIFAFGCSAGRHRSATIVNTISEILNKKGIRTNVIHRDMD